MDNDIEMDWIIDEHLKTFWSVYKKNGPKKATNNINKNLSSNGHLVVPVFLIFMVKNTSKYGYIKASTCIHIHYHLDSTHIEVLKDGWKNADTDPRAIDYWRMLFNEAHIALNEIRHLFKGIQIKPRPKTQFHTVILGEDEPFSIEEQKTTGYITMDYC